MRPTLRIITLGKNFSSFSSNGFAIGRLLDTTVRFSGERTEAEDQTHFPFGNLGLDCVGVHVGGGILISLHFVDPSHLSHKYTGIVHGGHS